MSLSLAAIAAAADTLATRRRHGVSGGLLPSDCRPQSVQDALRIQAQVMQRMSDEVGGWKCGTPQGDRLVVAPIYGSTIHQGQQVPVWPSALEGAGVRVEPELAFVLARDLPVRDVAYAPADVDAALSHAHLALELIASRYDTDVDQQFEDKLADGLVNQGLYLGPRVSVDKARAAQALSIAWKDAQATHPLTGVHPDREPLKPLYWLVEHLRAEGIGLKAGQVVITGSYAGTFPCPLHQLLAFSYGDLGQFELTFVSRSQGVLG